MNYKESLDFISKNEIDIVKVNIADQVETTIDEANLKQNNFEAICTLVNEAYNKTDGYTEIWQIVVALNDFLSEGKSLDKITVSELLEKASYYN